MPLLGIEFWVNRLLFFLLFFSSLLKKNYSIISGFHAFSQEPAVIWIFILLYVMFLLSLTAFKIIFFVFSSLEVIWWGFCFGLFAYLSCLMFSVLLGSVVWCLSLHLENSEPLLLLFCSPLPGILIACMWQCCIWSLTSWMSSPSALPLPSWCRLGDFYWPMFKFTDSAVSISLLKLPTWWSCTLSPFSVQVSNTLIIVILDSLSDSSNTCFVIAVLFWWLLCLLGVFF